MDELEVKSRIEKYLKNARPLFEGLKAQVPVKLDMEKVANEFYEMATCYYKDALHFYEKGRYLDALAALEYAEGWLDAGRLLTVLGTTTEDTPEKKKEYHRIKG